MPKILGLNVLAILLGSVAFYFVGFLWYGVIFQEAWLAAEGLTPEEVEGGSPIWMLGGLLITILQVIGLGLVMRWRAVDSIAGAVGTALTLWVFFALPFCHYTYLYTPAHNSTSLLLDASHLLVGWVLAAISLSLFRR